MSGLLGGIVDDIGDVVGDVGEVVGDAVTDVGGALSSAVTNISSVIASITTDRHRIIITPTDGAAPPATPPSAPTTTQTSTSQQPPPTSTATTDTAEQPPANSPPPQAPPPSVPPASAPPADGGNENQSSTPTGRPPSGATTPRPVALPVDTGNDSDDSGDDSSDESDNDSDDDESASGTPTPTSPLPASAPSSDGIDPGTGVGGITPSASTPPSSIEGEPTTTKSGGPGAAVVGTLATIGALIVLLAIFFLVRFWFIKRRRARRDGWAARPLTWATEYKLGYAATTSGTINEKSPSALSGVEQSHKPRSDAADLPVPAGWVDVELGRPTLSVRESIHSVESYGNLTREPLICFDTASITSSRPSVKMPAAAVLVSRWSPSPGGSSRDSIQSDSSDGSAHEDNPLFKLSRRSADTPEPQTTSPDEPAAPPPSKPRSVQSALMSALFTSSPFPPPVPSPYPSLTSPSVRRESAPVLPSDNPNSTVRNSSWTPPENWGSPRTSLASSTFTMARAHDMPTIVVTPPKSPVKPASEDPFASPLDHD